MRALVVPASGSTPSIAQIDRPIPASGEVLVRVAAATVNGFDLAVAGGMLEGMMEHRYPVVLGKDFAGTIEELGADVSGFAVGDRVFGVVTKEFLGDGAIGEFVTVPAATGLAHIPDSVSDRDAAALGLAGVTALSVVESAGLGSDSVVLVAGATGGVGTLVVQLAAATGATVIATAVGDSATALVRGLGASEIVDHTGDVAALVRDQHPDGVDVIVHLAGDPGVLLPALADGGRFVSALVMSADQVPLENYNVVPVFADASGASLTAVAAQRAAGSLTVPVDRVYPLDDAVAAFAQFGASKLGKIVIDIP